MVKYSTICKQLHIVPMTHVRTHRLYQLLVIIRHAYRLDKFEFIVKFYSNHAQYLSGTIGSALNAKQYKIFRITCAIIQS